MSTDKLIRRIDEIAELGVPVRVRLDGLKKLRPTVLQKCIRVLEEKNPNRRYWPIAELVMIDRSLAEQCFPDAPPSVPEHMRHAPEWLINSPITSP